MARLWAATRKPPETGLPDAESGEVEDGLRRLVVGRRRVDAACPMGVALLVVVLAAASCAADSEGGASASSGRGDAVTVPGAPVSGGGDPVAAGGGSAAGGGDPVAAEAGSVSEVVVAAGEGPGRGFVSVSVRSGVGCGLRAGGDVVCWGGWGDDRRDRSPGGRFVSVSVGLRVACGVRVGGAVVCWGAVDQGGWSAPSGEFTAVSVGDDFACGIRVGGSVACWGEQPDQIGEESWPLPEGVFEEVSAGFGRACGVRVGGSVVCWGRDWGPEQREGVFEAVSVGFGGHDCGIRVGGSVVCWGGDDFGQASPPPGSFSAVAAGVFFACGLRTDGEVVCWGLEELSWGCGGSWACAGWGMAPAPEGPFVAIAVGDEYWHSFHEGVFGSICAVRADGSLACWNGEEAGYRPPTGVFETLDSGARHTCGLRRGGEVVCWGAVPVGWSPPEGVFSSISVGTFHGCGLRPGGEAACWGYGEYGETEPPPGRFTALSAGSQFTCGLRPGGEAACWGSSRWWTTRPPPGPFTAVRAGSEFACGLRRGGEAACWGLSLKMAGQNPLSARTPVHDAERRPGPFSSLRLGDHECGNVDTWELACRRVGGAPAGGDGVLPVVRGRAGDACRPAGGTVDCTPRWGADSQPAGPFTVVSAGGDHYCGIRPAGTVECWSDGWPPGAGLPDERADPPGGYLTVDQVHFWAGFITHGSASDRNWREFNEVPVGRWLRGGKSRGEFATLDAGSYHACGVRADGAVACWGWRDGSDAPGKGIVDHPPPPGSFTTVSVAWWSACGIRRGGDVYCWHIHDGAPRAAPRGAFAAVAVGRREACGVAAGGSVICWDLFADGDEAEVTLRLAGPFTALDIGSGEETEDWESFREHGCAIRRGGGYQCWGSKRSGESAGAPAWLETVALTDIAAGFEHTCALRDTGDVLCWGDNYYRQTDAPPGPFTDIAAGWFHTCGLRPDGTPECWGSGFQPIMAPSDRDGPPPGPLTALTADGWHTCGLRPDGSYECWLHVSGEDPVCGLLADGRGCLPAHAG